MTIRPEDWELMGLEPGADIYRVKQAYRHRISLYQPTSLATYSLLDDDERETMIIRIEEAYHRIVGSEPPSVAMPDTAVQLPAAVEVPTGPVPDPVRDPGAHLRHRRLSRGLTLHRIAIETKIAVAILEQIENEDFAGLPAAAFVRGHVQQYAREIQLENADEFAGNYLAKMQGDFDDR
jgi:hypothetical protein